MKAAVRKRKKRKELLNKRHDSSMVEHRAVNPKAEGSSPSRVLIDAKEPHEKES